MTEAEIILCKWNGRVWPAKVLPRSPASRSRQLSGDPEASLCVEIFCLSKQLSVAQVDPGLRNKPTVNVLRVDTEPLKKKSIEDIASKLGQTKDAPEPVEEVKHRTALRMALDILEGGAPSPKGGPWKGRRENPAGRGQVEEATLSKLAATHQRLPSQKRKRKKRARVSGAATWVQVSPAEDQQRWSPSDEGEGPPSRKPSVSRRRGLSGEGGLDCRHRSVSRVKNTGTPPKGGKVGPLPEPSTVRKSPRFLKEEGERCRQGEAGGESDCPSPPSKRWAQTSTPIPRSARLTATGKRPGVKPGIRKKLMGSPVPPAAAQLADALSGTGKAAGKKCNRAAEESRGTFRKRLSRGPARAERLGSRPESSKGGVAPDSPVSEAAEGNRSVLVDADQTIQLQDLEDEEGLEPTSDLSLKLSPVRESSGFKEEEDEEELPSILQQQEPCRIKAGALVWCKLPRYPYWPAVVKRVKRKVKKASVLLVEKRLADKELTGYYVPLKNLKHYDCEEKQRLIDEAKESFSHEIDGCVSLIADYRIRVACCSFTGSFLEYCANDISYPVRREAQWHLPQATFPEMEEAGFRESVLGETPPKPPKKVLPDRTRAARDKANEKIVEFIVKAKGADEHLRAILRSKKPSRWLKKFLDEPPYVTYIQTYLEDDGQQSLVLNYLHEVYQEVGTKTLGLRNGVGTDLVIDVLFPEAIIYAISAVDHIEYKKAEEKYIRGPLVGRREKEIFEEEILEKKRKRQQETAASPSLQTSSL